MDKIQYLEFRWNLINNKSISRPMVLKEFRNSCEFEKKFSLKSETQFSETISFDSFVFKYDKSFLNKLKALSQELKCFITCESKAKSRIYGPSIRELNFDKNTLIFKIKQYIEAIDCLAKKDNKFNANNGSLETQDFKRNTSQQSFVIDIKSNESDSQMKCLDKSQPFVESNKFQTFVESNENNELKNSKEILNYCEQFIVSSGFNDLKASDFRNNCNSFNCFDVNNDCNECFAQTCYQCFDNCCNDCCEECCDSYCNQSCAQICFEESCLQSFNNCCFDGEYNLNENQIQMECEEQKCEQLLNSTQSLTQNDCDSNYFDVSQALKIVNRHNWSNTNYNIETGIVLKELPKNKVRTQVKRRNQIRFVLERILGLIEKDVYCTKRDLYYQNVILFDYSQRIVDEIIDDLACSLRVSRNKLQIVSSTRGLVFGHLKFHNTNGILTDCLKSPNGIAIPNDTEKLSYMQSNAHFVLIIEKDATFQQLIDLKIHEKYPIIMVTGHGYPDMNTRAFIQILWNSFNIPIFGLVDGDAHGLEILCTFRHGSLALSYESPNLVVPAIRWLGILPSDIGDYKLSKEVQIPLTANDRKKINDLKQRKYMIENISWTKQLNLLLEIGTKVEIQSLAEHSPTFLLDVYLPSKIRYGKWI